MPNVPSPNQLTMKGLNWLGQMHRKRMQDFGGEPDPDDDPRILEIRRRLIGMIPKSVEADFFRNFSKNKFCIWVGILLHRCEVFYLGVKDFTWA
jgi:hypothetical protein